MKKLALILGALMLMAVPSFAWEIDAEWQVGAMAFDENLRFTFNGGEDIAVFDRNDNLYYTGWFVTVGDYNFDELEGGIEFGIWLTEAEPSELEVRIDEWDQEEDGEGAFVLVDRTRLSEELDGDIYGYDFHAELGWGGKIGEESIEVAALMGYGFR